MVENYQEAVAQAAESVVKKNASAAREVMSDERYPMFREYVGMQIKMVEELLYRTLEAKGGGQDQLVEAKCMARLKGILEDLLTLPEFCIRKERDMEEQKDKSPTTASEW